MIPIAFLLSCARHAPGRPRTGIDDTSVSSNSVSRSTMVSPDALPVLSGLSNTSTDTHGPSAMLIAPNLLIADQDNTNLTSATITIANWRDGDRLDFSNSFALGHTFVEDLVNHTATLTLTGNSSRSNYQTTIRPIAFRTVAGIPPARTAQRLNRRQRWLRDQ